MDSMLKLKLVATDMDGTLLDSQKRLPNDFKSWVKQHPDIKTVIASGRQYYTLRKDFSDIVDKLVFIAENGGLVYAQDHIIYSNPMAYADVEALLTMFESMPNITPMLCGAQSAYMYHASPEAEAQGKMYYDHMQFQEDLYAAAKQDQIVKIALFIDDFQAEAVFRSLKMPNASVMPVLSGESWIDIANSSVSKGAALQAIQRQYAIKPEESMAFGDYLNDYTLLKACEESYCMANGLPEVKAVAKHITLSNDKDGVMVVLRNI